MHKEMSVDLHKRLSSLKLYHDGNIPVDNLENKKGEHLFFLKATRWPVSPFLSVLGWSYMVAYPA